MRITARTVPAGDQFMTRFPQFDDEMQRVFHSQKFDEIEVRKALGQWADSGFLTWGNDGRRSLAFAAEFLFQLTEVTKHVEKDMTTDAHTSVESAADQRMQRRMDRGRYAFTRFDITEQRGGIRVRVSCANPYDVLGNAISSARRFGVYACRILLYLKRELERERKDINIMLEGVGEMSDIFDEAAWNDRRQEEKDAITLANAERCKCQYRLGEYCSPSQPHCRCYLNGHCVEATLPENLKTYNKES
jgi:hypothetical protein